MSVHLMLEAQQEGERAPIEHLIATFRDDMLSRSHLQQEDYQL